MNVGLVCIAKDEDKYIDEWIKYHLKLGFDKIIIYQNDWDFVIDQPNVITKQVSGKRIQTLTYNECVKESIGVYDWLAFFDCDEFLVLKKHNNVKLFLNDYNNYDAIGINWVFFGDNNLNDINNQNYSVIERFYSRQLSVNSHIKTILKPSIECRMVSPHHQNLKWVDTSYNLNTGPFNKNPVDDIAQLNHYFCKTKEEFIVKVERGRADNGNKRQLSDFNSHNFNEIEDKLAHNFLKNDNNNILNP
jgi:hypothetical protein